MLDEKEHESRCGESFPMCALNPQRSTATSARCSFPLAIRVQHGARGEDLVCGSAASLPPCHENETLRSRQNQRSASVNLPIWQTVNLLALRLQWFESTSTHGSYRAILQVLKPLGGRHIRRSRLGRVRSGLLREGASSASMA